MNRISRLEILNKRLRYVSKVIDNTAEKFGEPIGNIVHEVGNQFIRRCRVCFEQGACMDCPYSFMIYDSTPTDVTAECAVTVQVIMRETIEYMFRYKIFFDEVKNLIIDNE